MGIPDEDHVIWCGMSTVGKLLAAQLGYKFFDFSQEVEAYFNSHITFCREMVDRA